MNAKWPFRDPENLAVFTTKQILEGSRPILCVTHEIEDGAWQFLSGDPVQESDARIIGLSEALEMDPAIAELADLTTGWKASRATSSSPWRREQV